MSRGIKIPTFQDVMDDEDEKKVPSFADVMGEPVKKKVESDLGLGDFPLPELPEEVAKKSSTRISQPLATPKDIADNSGAPMTMEQMQDVLKNPIKTEQDKITFKIKESTQDWYLERGGYTPEQKIVSFNTELEDYKQTTDYTPEELANTIGGLADKWGLLLSKDEETGGVKVSISPTEIEQYNEIVGREIKKHLKEKAKTEQDPFIKDVFQALEVGSTQVLNSVSNFMAISEKAGNILLSPIRDTESTYYQNIAGVKREKLEEVRQQNQRYEEGIVESIQDGNIGQAVGQTVLSVAENIPQLAVLAMGNVAGYVEGTLGFMGASVASEEYLKMDEDPNINEFTKIANALGKGLSEVIYEGVGTMTILSNVRKTMAKSSKDVVREALYRSYQPYLERKLSVLMKGVSPMVREGASEGATELTNNIMDIASGKDVGVMDNVGDAMIIGGVIGLGLSSPTLVSNRKGFVDEMVKALPKDFSLEAKEELIALHVQYDALNEAWKDGNAVDKKRYEKQLKEIDNRVDEIHLTEGVSPEGTLGAVEEGQEIKLVKEKPKEKKEEPKQEAIPVYKIGEKEFKNQDEFIAEVETYKGKKDTPKIVVENDEATTKMVEEVLEVAEKPVAQKAEEVKGKVETIKEEPTDAEKVRGDKEVLPEQGIKPGESKDKGGEDIQLTKEEGGEASKQKLPQEVKPEKPSESLLAAKQDVFTTVENIGKQKIPKEKKLAEMKAAMTDFIRANRKELEKVTGQKIPTMINRVNEVKTVKSFKKATDYIDSVVEDVKFREEEKTLRKAEQVFDEYTDVESKKYTTVKEKIKKLKAPLRKGVGEKLKRVRHLAYERTSDEVAAMTDIVDKKNNLSYAGVLEKLNTQGTEALTAEEYDLYEETKFAGAMIEPRTGEEMTKLAKELKDYVGQIKTESRKKYEADRIILEDKIHNQAIPILTKGEKVKSEVGEPERKRSLGEKIRERTAIPTLASWHSLLDALGVKQGKTQIYDTWFNREYGEPIHEANNKFFEGRTEVLNMVIDQYREIFGGKWKTIEREFKQKKTHEYTDEFGAKRLLKLSQEEMGYFYGQMQDEKLNPTMAAKGMRFMKKNKDGEYDLTKKGEALMENIDSQMKEWMDWQINFYRDFLYDRYNEEYNKLYGRDMPKSDIYIPLFREGGQVGDTVEDMFRNMNLQSLGGNRHMMSRTRSTEKLREVGATEVLINYINRMERFRAFGEPLRKINRELMHPDVQRAIEQEFPVKTFGKRGTGYNAVIRDFVDDFSGKHMPGRYSQFFEGVRIRATQAMLGLKPTLMMKQITSFPAYGAFVPFGRLATGMLKFAANPQKATRLLMRSQFLKERKGKGFERDQVDAMVKDYNSLGSAKNKFIETSMIFIKYGDMAPILFGGYSVYDYHYNQALKQGKSEKEADDIGMRKFEFATKFTQQSSLTDDLSYWQRHSSISKLMTMYATAPYSYIRLVNAGVRRIVQEGDVKRGAKAILLGHVVLPVLFRAASMAFDFDDDDEGWKDLVQAGILGPFDSMFIFGDAISYLADQYRGKPFDYQVTPAASVVNEASKAMITAKKALEEAASKGLTINDVLEISDAVAQAGGLMFGIPYVGARRTIGQWGNIASGEVEGVPDITRALLGFKTEKKKGKEER